MSVKERVPLASVSPSGQNPRRDFGDVSALARSIRATGGQPVNPIVVARDGDGYRIVDGERRYRAMLELGATEADALVCDDWGEAEEAVAMMATDDKKQLSGQERLRGFQGMLCLGVSDEVAGAAAGVEPAVVRRARRVSEELPDQLDLDAFLCAVEFDDPAERERVYRSDCPAIAARSIRRGHEQEASRARLRALMEGLGVEFRERGKPQRWDAAEHRERGVAYACHVSTPGDVDDLREAAFEEALVAWPEGDGWDVYRQAPPEETERERAAREIKGLRSASHDAALGLARSVARWAAGLGAVPHDLASLVREWRSDARARDLLGVSEGGSDPALAAVMDSDPSAFELAQFLDAGVWAYGVRGYDGGFDAGRARAARDLWDAAVADGWDPAGCDAMRAELDAWERSGGGES